eukprot:538354-Rhodomonas_salina.1
MVAAELGHKECLVGSRTGLRAQYHVPGTDVAEFFVPDTDTVHMLYQVLTEHIFCTRRCLVLTSACLYQEVLVAAGAEVDAVTEEGSCTFLGCFAVCGTESGYAATRCGVLPVLRAGMLLRVLQY